MAATNYTPISLYYSSTATNVPLAANLVAGELAINTADEKLYFKNSSGVVKLLASNATTTNVSSITFGTTGLTPSTATTGAVTVAGTLATANGGTNLTSFTSGGAVYATSTTVLATGTLPVTAGGTGLTTLTAGYIPYGNGTSAFGNESNLTYDATNNRLGVVGTGYSPNITLSDAATIAWDTTTGQVATFTFVSSNRTMGAPTSLVSGAFYALAVIQNSGSNTLTWNSVFKWTAGTAPTLSTAASAKDYFVFRSDGTNLYEQGRSQGVA